ncbi:PHP domain-containing protein [Clostridium sp. 'White wine YQ']|uniref:PHP domain-containing protein n=1 Tax=Clostridium sp. 'White wine YQ' TaxID=3027474 RepID=UPI00236593D3|nr:PHP domain-containing protein [Clostridium sp. 'White wine YQ']MDD7795389.1 PHP domain-containing protein [Clostridium sp. 'White wine YQ']
MIDLHIHTTTSDGSDEPKDILIKAQQLGLKYISITDHDSIGAYKKLNDVNIHDYYDGKLIPGCEFSAVHNGKPIEILGYGIDFEVINSTGIVSDEKFYDRENSYLNKMKEICRNLNIKYSEDLSINGKYFATQMLHADIRKYPENEKLFDKDIWGNLNAFYRTCVNNPESPFFLDQMKDYMTVQEAATLIKKAGGKSFLAHLYGYFVEDHTEFLNSIVSLNALDGIECYHSLHSIERTKYLLNYCNEHNIYSSGGSDYHGKLKPNVKMGESIADTKIPYDILKPWLPSNVL